MTTATATPTAKFDAYAAQYESALQNGLRLTGEGPEYFARRRIEWTARVVRPQSPLCSVLDFGCGVGLATPLLTEILAPQHIWGFDPSSAAIERAQCEFGNSTTNFTATVDELPRAQFDLAYCNGVFHHIDPPDRSAVLRSVWNALRPGGWFAFWENNPWNLGTRVVMRRIPFDRDAVVISPFEAGRLLRRAGFQAIRRDAWFLFPRALAWLRPLESLVHRLPLGAQYLVLARKPE